MLPIEICPTCNGAGRIFRQMDESHRQERLCPDCDGTGSLADAVAGKLSGEAEERLENQEHDPRLANFKVPFTNHFYE